jgi:molybdopterin molybdotransferase
VLGLPGNPVSALVTALVFLRPAVAALSGRQTALPRKSAFAAVDLPENGPRADFMRAHTRIDADGRLLAEPLAKQDSSMLSFLASADALLFRPPGAPTAAAGAPVEVVSLAEAMAF